MRPTKSKIKAQHLKKLRQVETRTYELWHIIHDSKQYVSIPRRLVGFKIKLVPIDSLKNRDDGLSQAVEAATSWFTFSERPFRLCNVKNYECEFRNKLHPWMLSADEQVEKMYFKDKLFKRGTLTLLDISEQQFQKLPAPAKKYFVQGLDSYDKRGNAVFIYHPDIPKTFVREYVEKLYWNRLFIPNGRAVSEEKRLSNWLDYEKECKLRHYKGKHSWKYYRGEKHSLVKKRRSQEKQELAEQRHAFYQSLQEETDEEQF